MPVGLNYDRVIEDRVLLRERNGPVAKPPLRWRILGLIEAIAWLPYIVLANVLRVATRSHRKLGYCAIEFGEPLLLSDWPGGSEIHLLEDEARKEAFEALATEILEHRVAPVIPATPVAILCTALLRDDDNTLIAVRRRVATVLAELRSLGAPVALGEAFESVRTRRQEDGVEAIFADFDASFLDAEEAELVTLLAGRSLQRRRVLLPVNGRIEILDGELPVVQYYVNSIAHHWPEGAPVEVEGTVAPPQVPILGRLDRR